MGKPRRSIRAVMAVLAVSSIAVTVLAGCAGGGGEAEAGRESTITVFAASSLTDAFAELAEIFERQNSGTTVRKSFGASSALLVQIRHGAPADVFAVADEAKMEAAGRAGLLAGEPRTFATNRLVVLVSIDNPAGIERYNDLAAPGVKLVLAQDEVPVAEYAKESFKKASRLEGDFQRRVLSNVVSREVDVRAAVNRVALGDADATIAYASDVTPETRDRVDVVEVPEEFNVVATYPIAVLEESASPNLARRWVELVLSEEGQRVLGKWGFEPVVR